MKDNPSRSTDSGTQDGAPLFRLALLFSLLLNLLSLIEYASNPPFSLKTIALTAAGILVHFALLWAAWAKGEHWIRGVANALIHLLSRLGVISLIAFTLAVIMVSPGIPDLATRFNLGRVFQLFLVWLVVLLGGFALRAWQTHRHKEKSSWGITLGLSLLLTAAGYLVFEHLAQITSYPFTLQWSETSRIYYASLFLSERLYGLDLPWPVLHPSQYLSLAAPFLIPNASLWLHRFWEAFLWLGTSLATAVLLVRRLSLAEQGTRWRLVLWIFIFLLASPVYYHLLFSIILLLWLFESSPGQAKGRLLISLLAVGIASLWAGLSRVNWLPVPGMLAAALYLLERPVQPGRLTAEEHRTVRYLAPPLVMVIGCTLLAAGAYAVYILLSGNPLQDFTTSYVSNMLWHRLLPNTLFPPGILLGLALYCSAPLLLLFDSLRQQGWGVLHPTRWAMLAAMLLVLLGGGLEVSVKIGGGNNLHNLDAFMLLLLVIALYLACGKAVPEAGLQTNDGKDQRLALFQKSRTGNSILLACLLVPAIFTFAFRGSGLQLPEQEVSNQAMAEIKVYAEDVAQTGGQVLFITNRHLVTFGYIQVPLVPEYERVILMEMAMANNHTYLDQFFLDLENQRFSLIITEPLSFQVKAGAPKEQRDESEIWAAEVMKVLRRFYKTAVSYREVGIDLLVPKKSGGE